MKDICVITYTTSKYKDVWPMHFGQLNKHLKGLRSYVFTDIGSKELFEFSNHTVIEHDDSLPYWQQYVEDLKTVDEEFVIYSQEDFILFDDINIKSIERYASFLRNSDYDYVRLIRCGYKTPLDRPVQEDIFAVDMTTNDAFSMQATLWKKNRMIDLYHHVRSEKWLEAEHWNIGCRELGIKGTFVYNGEPRIGEFHYDSRVWPYVCTAINKGKWNVDQYPRIMKDMFSKYDVDPNVRGIRKR